MIGGKKLQKIKALDVRGKKHKILFDDGVSELPGRGYVRDEILARRQDALDEANEAASKYMTVGVGDMRSIKPEREILAHYDSVSVTNKVKGFCYAWVCEDYPMNSKGLKIREKELRTGWEIVCGDMPEAMERKEVRGYRKLGDTVLMRCPAFLEKQNVINDRQRMVALQESVTGGLEEKALQAASRGVARLLEADDPRFQKALEKAVASQLARGKFDHMLREGQLPGAEVGT